MSKPAGLLGPDCCYCGRHIGINQQCHVVKGYGTYVGWRHKHCHRPTNEKVWSAKVEEAQEFVAVLRSGDRSSLPAALRWGR